MPLYSPKEALNLNLTVFLTAIKDSGTDVRSFWKWLSSKYYKKDVRRQPKKETIDNFIKERYAEKIQQRRTIISDEDLGKELLKVKTFSWGVVQGQLDQKIQNSYVRKFVRYDDLFNSVRSKLYDDIANYVVCTWFNHWTTVLIEEHISTNRRVIPTIKNIKGIDIFLMTNHWFKR